MSNRANAILFISQTRSGDVSFVSAETTILTSSLAGFRSSWLIFDSLGINR